MKKYVLCLLMICLLFVSACSKKEEKKENDVINSTPTSKARSDTNNKLGNLNYFIPDKLRLNGTSTELTKIYEITNDTTNISVWYIIKKDISVSLEEYMKTDPWEPDVNSMTKKNYNGHEWYETTNGDVLFTKYNNDVYKIRISVLEDNTNYFSTIRSTFKMLNFE